MRNAFSLLAAAASLAVLPLLGNHLVAAAGLPLPGSVAGMLMLLAALMGLKRIPPALLRVGRLILTHMLLLFIPIVAGIVNYVDALQGQWLAIVAASVIGAMITLAVTMLAFHWAMRRFGGKTL